MKVMYSVLDWGLGHATRSIPIIQELLDQGAEVYLAGSGAPIALLKKEFPELNTINLPAYGVKYSKSKWALGFVIAKQIPQLIKTLKLERQLTEKAVKEFGIVRLISDGRFGARSDYAPSVYVCHQIRPMMPLALVESLFYSWHKSLMNKFSQVWIPDFKEDSTPNNPSLAFKLSNPQNPPLNQKFVGVISRFKKQDSAPHILDCIPRLDWVFSCSGPEPQRTFLENQMRRLAPLSGKVLLLRGVPNKDSKETVQKENDNLWVANHLESSELEKWLRNAECVLSRSGYTTLMDLSCLEKKAFFVPTPGQTEQEYLADKLADLGLCNTCNQSDLAKIQNLEIPERPLSISVGQSGMLKQTVSAFLYRN
jgi:predicted glycosyltransferase